MTMRRLAVWPIIVAQACSLATRGTSPKTDLAITNASVLDVRTDSVLPAHTVLITDGVITGIAPSSEADAVGAKVVIDAYGRLLTPGFIDAHSHTFLILPDSQSGHDSESSRRTLARAYLPYGVTVVRDAGSAERQLPMLVEWTKRSRTAPDFYPVGAQLVSIDPDQPPLPHQVAVADSQAAAAKVREYYELGLRNIKLYWRLREAEFKGALYEARRRELNITAHVDLQVLTIDRALDLGLPNLEHIHPLAYSLMTQSGFDSVMAAVPRTLGISPPPFPPTALYMNVPELWNYLGPNNPRVLAVIARMKANNVSLTPTLHVFAQRLGFAYFESTPRDSTEDTSPWTAQQRARAGDGYRIMAAYVKRMYEAGIRLNVGTDARDPGKAVLSEMLLLHDAGIPMSAVFRIATLDTAAGIGHEAEYGSVDVGKRANLILFDANPLQNPRALLEGRVVIKDGVVWGPAR